MTFHDVIATFVLPAATSVAMSGLLVWLFKEWISTRLKVGIQHEYDRKLEIHKSELKQDQELAILNITTAVSREAAYHATAHASFAAGQKAAMERRLSAIDRLWSHVLKLRTNLPAVLTFIDVMTVDEYRSAKDHPNFREMTEDLTQEEIAKFVSQGIEEVRPYTGEYLWTLFFCYQAILLRILLLLHLGRNDAEKIEWHKDGGIRQLISAVLTPAEARQFDETTFGKVSWIKQRLEAKILGAAHKVISGESFGAESLEQATQIQQSIGNINLGLAIDAKTKQKQ